MTKEKTTKKLVKKVALKPKEKKIAEALKEKKPKVLAAPLTGKPETPLIIAKPQYLYSVGRRKSAIAQVRIYSWGRGNITINNRDLKVYFPSFEFQNIVTSPLKLTGQETRVDVLVKVRGGGKRGQAESIRHGIARALLKLDENFRKSLKKAGFLTRDVRIKERKKPGLKRARRAPQWQKR